MDHSPAPLLLASVSPHIPLFHPYMASPPPPPPTRSTAPRRSSRQIRQLPSLDIITANTATTSTLDSTVYQQQQQSASSPSTRGRQQMTVSVPARKRSRHDSGDEQDEELPSPGGAVKRKRTRTLTTPAQATALYALLAETRFPTTQQRETVGASIGLSARKVQIWFQNQRQKARRLGEPGRPPTTMVLEPSLTATHGPPTFYRADQPILASPPAGWQSAPVSAQSHQQSYTHPSEFEVPRRPGSSMGPMFGPGVSQPSGSTLGGGGVRATPPYQATPKREPPIVLPPLQFDMIKTKAEMMASHAAVGARGPSPALHATRFSHSSSSTHPRSDLMRPQTPASVITPSPGTSGEYVNPSALEYSPPFTLQPEPYWNPRDRDPISFNPGPPSRHPHAHASPLPPHMTAEGRTRSRSDASSRTSYGHAGPSQLSPTSRHPHLSQPVARGGRFDPVRGQVTPSPPHESMPPPPPASGSGSGSRRESGLPSPVYRESDSSRRK